MSMKNTDRDSLSLLASRARGRAPVPGWLFLATCAEFAALLACAWLALFAFEVCR